MNNKKAWYKKFSNWIVIVICIFLVPILAMNLYIMIQSKIHKDEVPNVFGYKPFMVLSGSMETKIHKGDLIITKIVDPTTLNKKDIIAFRDSQNTVTTHRIIDIVENEGVTYFITKGDNNSSQDQNLVEFEDVEGIYVGRIPGIGSIMDTLAKPTSIIIILLGLTVIFVVGFTISTQKQRKIEQKEFLEFKTQKEELAKSENNSKNKKKSEDSN